MIVAPALLIFFDPVHQVAAVIAAACRVVYATAADRLASLPVRPGSAANTCPDGDRWPGGLLIESLVSLLSATYAFALASLTFVGEVVFMIWLLAFAAGRGPVGRSSLRLTTLTTLRNSSPKSRS